jgi:hypothetical protein
MKTWLENMFAFIVAGAVIVFLLWILGEVLGVVLRFLWPLIRLLFIFFLKVLGTASGVGAVCCLYLIFQKAAEDSKEGGVGELISGVLLRSLGTLFVAALSFKLLTKQIFL